MQAPCKALLQERSSLSASRQIAELRSQLADVPATASAEVREMHDQAIQQEGEVDSWFSTFMAAPSSMPAATAEARHSRHRNLEHAESFRRHAVSVGLRG